MKIPVYETDKKIALGFSCNNNTEEEITRALDPWKDKVDYIIAVEGRYKVPYSPEMLKQPIPPKFGENTHAILDKHYGSEIGSDKLIYIQFYGEQKKKRQQYMDIAGAFHCDALVVWDTDEWLFPHGPTSEEFNYCLNWEKFYKKIALAHEFIEVEAGILDMWFWVPNEDLWPKQHNQMETNQWHRRARVHLNPDKQKYILNHHTFVKDGTTEEDVLKFDSNPDNKGKWNPYVIYPLGVAEGIRFTMDRKLRSKETNSFGSAMNWQIFNEEKYREYLIELRVQGLDKVVEEQYREPFTYYFDERGQIVEYTNDEQELFEQLEL